MNKNELIELVPHYLAMVVAVLIVLNGIRLAVGELGFWAELGIVFVVVLLYRPIVQRLDMAPSVWEG